MTDLLQEIQTLLNLENDLNELSLKWDCICEDNQNVKDSEITRIKLENVKLRHQLGILQKALAVEKCKTNFSTTMKTLPLEKITGMISMHEHLTNLFTLAIIKSYPQMNNAKAIISPVKGYDIKFGDYQCNSAMSVTKVLQKAGIQISTLTVAKEIAENVGVSPLVEKIHIAGSGYINVFLDKFYIINVLTNLLRFGVQPPQVKHRRIVIDFSSPNIAKEMHVGHLRSTIIGESISRLLEYMGHHVIRVNHLGDWGTQFGMLIAHLEDRFPNYLCQSLEINDLQMFYKESKHRFDNEQEFKRRAYDRVVRLQTGEENPTKAWSLICDISRKEFQKIYDRLDITLNEKGESFYQSRMMDTVNLLESKNLLFLDEGRKIMWPLREHTGIPLTIVKTDGSFTYDTSDMAAIRYRLEEEKADWIIYVVDAGQGLHLKNIFSAAERCGILDPKEHRVDHVDFGVVLAEDGKKFKTRSGDTVKLSELLDEGLKRSLYKLKEKGRDKVLTSEELRAAQESIAYGCIKYADLSHNRTNEYIFSFDKMLEDRGNTAVYLLYAYTRICSIVRNCGEDFSDINKILSNVKISLEHEKEWKLAKILLKFPDILLKISEDLLLHVLCEFCFEICSTFSEFYDNCYCIEKDKSGAIIRIQRSRILLCEATASILRVCFHILGLKPVERI